MPDTACAFASECGSLAECATCGMCLDHCAMDGCGGDDDPEPDEDFEEEDDDDGPEEGEKF